MMATKNTPTTSLCKSLTTATDQLSINLKTGTKTRTPLSAHESPGMALPESIDLKITNQCDMANVCTYCHESSTKDGDHADFNYLVNILGPEKVCLELAIGGGNPLSYDKLDELLIYLDQCDYINNITINQLHIKKYGAQLVDYISRELIHGVGLSYRAPSWGPIHRSGLATYNHLVWHLILGVHTPKDLDRLLGEFPNSKILLLGYKTFGFGKEHRALFEESLEKAIQSWQYNISRFMKDSRISVLSFDNLAIKQLVLKRLFTDDYWNEFYMGDDGNYSMYIDGVDKITKRNSYAKNYLECNDGFVKSELFSNVEYISDKFKRLQHKHFKT